MESMKNEKLLEKALGLLPTLYENKVPAQRAVEFTKENGKINETSVGNYGERTLGKGDSLTLDFGDHYVGYLSLDLKSIGSHPDAPALLRIRFAERPVELFEDASEYHGWISPSWIQEELVHVDVLPTLYSMERRYSFRYVRIDVVDISSKYSLKISDAFCRAVSSADDTALLPYSTDNKADQRIDAISVKTLHDCMQTVFEDGPKRDRRLWMGDLRIQALANYETYRANDMVKANLYLFGALTQEDGRVGACLFLDPVPEVDDTCMFDYSLFFVDALYDYYEATGDRETVSDLWQVCKRQIELSKENLNERNIVRDSDRLGWCFVDWNLELNKQASAQGIFLYTLERAIQLAACIGDVLAEEEYAELYLKLKEAANAFLLDQGTGLYRSGSDGQISAASLIWMILGGAVEGAKAAKLLEKLEGTPDALKMVTPYMYHHYIEALIKTGRKEKALEIMRAYWGGMADHGADTFWELYNPENPDESPYGGTIVNSYCHAWSCGPAYFLRKYYNRG